MSEEPYLYSYLTGPEYLRLVGRLRRVPDDALDDKIERFLHLLGIYDDRYQTPDGVEDDPSSAIVLNLATVPLPRRA